MLSDTSVQEMNAHRQPFENKSLEIVRVDCCYFFPLLLTKYIVIGGSGAVFVPAAAITSSAVFVHFQHYILSVLDQHVMKCCNKV